MAKNIFSNHSLDDYKKKYGNVKNLKSYTDQQVEDHLKKTEGKSSLLDGSDWWHIGGVYYQVPHKKPNKGLIAGGCVLAAGAIAAAVTLPIVLNKKDDPVTPVIKYFTVSFDSNGGTPVESQTVKEGDHATKPKDDATTKNGYTFVNWTRDGSEFDFENTKINCDITLQAQWTVLYHTVSFRYSDTEEVIEEAIVPYNGAVTMPTEEPTFKSGNKAFNGWYKTKDCKPEDEYDFNTPITGDLILYAGFTESYDVEYYLNDFETAYKTVLVPQGSIAQPLTPSEYVDIADDYADCELEGWYTDPELSTPYYFNEPLKGGVKLFAKWKTNSQDFYIQGSHNVDNESGTTLRLISNDTNHAGQSISGKNTVMSYDDTLFQNNLPALTLSPIQGIGVGSDEVTVTKTYKNPAGDSQNISKTFEVEIGSYNKLDTEALENGEAKAKSKDITGMVYIPKRYYSEEKGRWVSIKKIADNGFDGTNIDGVYISVPTIEIGKDAFKDCDGLKELEFEDKSNTWAFTDSEGKEVELNPNNPDELSQILNNLKEGNGTDKAPTKTGLTFVEIYDGPTLVAYGARQDDDPETNIPDDVLVPAYVYYDEELKTWVTTYKEGKSLPVTRLSFDNNAEEGSQGAFEGCKNIKTFTVHSKSNLNYIGQNAFKNCTNLHGVYFLDNERESGSEINVIDYLAFYNTINLKSIELPDSISNILDYAFAMESSKVEEGQNNGLESISIPKNIITASNGVLGEGVFQNCTNLNSVTFNDNDITTLRSHLFENCSSLNQITIPFSISIIQQDAFKGTGLTSVSFEDSTSRWDTEAGERNVILADGNTAEAKERNAELLKKYSSATSLCKNQDEYPDFEFKQIDEEDPTKGFALVAYHGKEQATITIPSCLVIPNPETKEPMSCPVVKIEDNVFNSAVNDVDVSAITKIVIPNTVKTIGKYAFANMPVLSSIQFPYNVGFVTLPEGAFENSGKLNKITIPTTINTIEKNAFKMDKVTNDSKGATSVDFGLGLVMWDIQDSKKTSYKAYSSGLNDNATALKSTYAKYQWSKSKQEALYDVSYSILKTVYEVNEGMSSKNFAINTYSSKGVSKNISSDSNVRYYEYVYGYRDSNKAISTPFKDVTSDIKNGKYTSSKETIKYLKIEITIGGTIYTNCPSDMRIDKNNLIKIYFTNPDDDSNFKFTLVEEGNPKKGCYVDAASGAKFGETIIVPSSHTFDGVSVPVVSIGKPYEEEGTVAFSGIQGVNWIVLPSTISTIGIGAFAKSGFEYVDIPYGVFSINQDAFLYATNLKYLIFPESLYVLNLGEQNCEEFTFQDPTIKWHIVGPDIDFTPATMSDEEINNFINAYKKDCVFKSYLTK